jgi:phage repressor protein C with HTH and peptisase S24 domain
MVYAVDNAGQFPHLSTGKKPRAFEAKMRDNSPMINQGLIDRITERLAAVGLKPRTASLRAGLGADAIRSILRGKSQYPRTDTLAKLAPVLGTTLEYLSTGHGPAELSEAAAAYGGMEPHGSEVPPAGELTEDRPESGQQLAQNFPKGAAISGDSAPGIPLKMYPAPEFGARDLPVRGVAAAGTDALFVTNGEPHDWLLRPAVLIGVSEAYAVIAAGTSMEPRYFDGEVVFVHPGRRVAPGRHTFVVVQFYPDEEGEAPMALIKKYERQTGTELILSQYNPSEELRFPIETVKSIHLIVNPGEAR